MMLFSWMILILMMTNVVTRLFLPLRAHWPLDCQSLMLTSLNVLSMLSWRNQNHLYYPCRWSWKSMLQTLTSFIYMADSCALMEMKQREQCSFLNTCKFKGLTWQYWSKLIGEMAITDQKLKRQILFVLVALWSWLEVRVLIKMQL